MYIAEDKIADIKNTADIVEIITDFIVLKKSGKNYVGLCPFHSEKTPSFTVSPEKQIFHCFGCGEGGNVFTFLMKKEGITFPEAIRMIGKRYGIEIPDSAGTQKKRRYDEKEILFSINAQAMKFYQDNLYNSTEGKKAMTYIEKRGVKEEIIRDFNLGYAPDAWNNLLNFFLKKGLSVNLAEKAGLVLPRKNNNGHYDRFRNRIIFPIIDMNLRVIGFGGRVLDDSMPKYMNSPETPVFQKGRSMYGLNMAKLKCRDTETVYIVEGYFDLLALHQHEVQNSVATLGTSLTPQHVELLRNRYVGENGKAVLVFDSDEAGIKAAQRSIEIFKQGYLDVEIFVLPEGFDPDSYMFKFGRESFLKAAGNALNPISFLINSAIKRHGQSIEGKFRIVSDMVKHFTGINDEVTRSLYIKELAERIDIDEAAIARKVKEESDKLNKRERNNIGQYNENVNTVNGKKDKGFIKGKETYKEEARIERHIVSMMLQFPEILTEISERNILELFRNEELKSIGQIIVSKISDPDGNVSEIISEIDDVDQRNLVTSLAVGEDVWDHKGCLKLIRQFESSRNRYKGDLTQRIKAAEDSNNNELLLELLKEKQDKVNMIKNDLESLGGKNK